MKLKDLIKEADKWEAPDIKVYKELEKLSDKVYLVVGRYQHKADVGKAIHTWMTGLHAGLKKRGIKGIKTILESERIFKSPYAEYGIIVGRKPIKD